MPSARWPVMKYSTDAPNAVATLSRLSVSIPLPGFNLTEKALTHSRFSREIILCPALGLADFANPRADFLFHRDGPIPMFTGDLETAWAA